MSEPLSEGMPQQAQTAGALLRAARQARGMHIAALAAAIKVSQRKLEALEADRYEELPDTTFTRALAQTVCRALKIDAEPVLDKLPPAPGQGFDVSSGLNAPFRPASSRRDGGERTLLNRPVVWGSAALVVAALVLYWLPPNFWTPHEEVKVSPPPAASAPSASAPTHVPISPPANAASATPEPVVVASAPVASAPASASASGAEAAAAPALSIRTTNGPSWVEVQDATGKLLIARTLAAGESVSFDAPAPLRVKIGNAAVAQLSFRGHAVALDAGRDNVARLELK
jgi:cytoskeleton protein RodZ